MYFLLVIFDLLFSLSDFDFDLFDPPLTNNILHHDVRILHSRLHDCLVHMAEVYIRDDLCPGDFVVNGTDYSLAAVPLGWGNRGQYFAIGDQYCPQVT